MFCNKFHAVTKRSQMHPNTMKRTETLVLGPMDQFSIFCNKFHAVTKGSQMDPNTTKQTETLVLGPMGWIGCIRCEKSRCDFVARSFALIAPVHPVLHRVSCSYKTIPKAPKHNERHQNMS